MKQVVCSTNSKDFRLATYYVIRNTILVKRVRILVCSFILFVLFSTQLAFAAKFNSMSLRLDRTAANAALSGLVCAIPSSIGAGTEGKISILFPTDFTISGNTANWTTSTTALPSYASAWPGIGSTAQSVSGSTVTFASNDLTSMTKYCFTFTAVSSTTGSSGNSTATITTKTSSNTTIDQTEIGVPIGNDQITVSATVPASPYDFSSQMDAQTTGSNFPQNTTLDYQLTYGSSLSTPATIEVVASWSQGTITGQGSPSVDSLSYVVGSASNGYNNAPPVIDTLNNTITWTIPNFPAYTSQSVTFQLKTTSNYTGANSVSFTVSGVTRDSRTSSTTSSVTQTYLYNSSLEPTPTATPTSTPGPYSTSTPTPTVTPATAFEITDVAIESITAKNVTISILLSKPASITLHYGTTTSAMTSTITSPTLQTNPVISLDSLTPETPYFFRVQATDGQGKTISSDIFTFTTAKDSTPATIDPKSIVFTSENVFLFNAAIRTEEGKLPTVVIIRKTPYEFQFSLSDNRVFKRVRAKMINEKVLGFTSIEETTTAGESITLTETAPGTFTGRLKSDTPGLYLLIAEIADEYGNLTEENLAHLRVVTPLTILETGSKKPVENAKVLLSLYNPKTGLYEKMTSLPFPNPAFSRPDGTVHIILPYGRYQVEVLHDFYAPQTTRFTIGKEENENYPTIYLKRTTPSLVSLMHYFSSTISDLSGSSREALATLLSSSRFTDLLLILSLLLFILLSFLSLLSRLHLSLWALPLFLRSKWHAVRNKNHTYLKVLVIDKETALPVAYAQIHLNHLLFISNRQGVCYCFMPNSLATAFSVTKHGYLPEKSKLSYSSQSQTIKIALTPHIHPILAIPTLLLKNLLYGTVELWLVASFLTVFIIGIKHLWPLFLLTLLNFSLWLIYLHELVMRRKNNTV
ncbi:hypothetical protein BH11PAT1_BH11PAT1_0220 [soil metagenome]